MTKLTGKVGAEPNRPNDVRAVQRLLNLNIGSLTPLALLAEDGHCGDRTRFAIAEFQRRVLKFAEPDGVVDPDGTTLKTLIANAPKVLPVHVQTFINQTLPAARRVKEKWSIPISVLIAQAAIESGWGGSVKDNAFFGIKGKSTEGASSTFTTHEVIGGKTIKIQAEFRAYKDFEEAAEDYGRFLNDNSRYRKCFAYIYDPEKFADELAKAGYATDPNYATKIKTIIRSFGLAQYDRMSQ